MPIREDFSVPAGDDVLLEFTIDADEGVTLDNAEVKWQLYATRLGLPVGPALVEKDTVSGGGVEITDATERTFSVSVNQADTEDLEPGRYYHEAEVTDVIGNKITVTTGILTITPTEIANVESG